MSAGSVSADGQPVVVDAVVDGEGELAPAGIGHDGEAVGDVVAGERGGEKHLERDGVVARDRDDRDAAAQRECARGGDPDAQPGERAGAHARGDMRERSAGLR